MTGKIERKLMEWIKEAYNLEQEMIILGDFNGANKSNRKNKLLTKCIKRHMLQDVHESLAGKDVLDTWKRGELSSRIDYIFSRIYWMK